MPSAWLPYLAAAAACQAVLALFRVPGLARLSAFSLNRAYWLGGAWQVRRGATANIGIVVVEKPPARRICRVRLAFSKLCCSFAAT